MHELGIGAALCTVAAAWLWVRRRELGPRRGLVLTMVFFGLGALVLALGKYGGAYTLLADLPVLKSLPLRARPGSSSWFSWPWRYWPWWPWRTWSGWSAWDRRSPGTACGPWPCLRRWPYSLQPLPFGSDMAAPSGPIPSPRMGTCWGAWPWFWRQRVL